MKKVKFGIIGPGGIAHKFADACSYLDEVELVGVASSKLEKASAFAKEFEIAKAFDNYDDLLVDEEIEAVYISVINSKHLEVIKKCAKAKKAILCEKPCVVNKEESDELLEVLKKYNVLFMEAMWTNFLPAIIKAKEWVKEGKIGKLKSVESSFSFWEDKNKGGRLFEKELWGGSLLDVGIYTIAFAMNITDEIPTDVKAFEYIGSTNVDEYGTVLMKFNDVIGIGNYGITLNRPLDASIFGDKGRIELDYFFKCEEIRLYDRDNNLIETFKKSFKNGFTYEIKHFCQLYLDGKKESDIISLSLSKEYTNVIEKIRLQR